jgi:hypothetical protein
VTEVAWIFDRLFIPRRLDFGRVAVVPLRVKVDAMGAALAAYRTGRRAPPDGHESVVAVMDMAAIVFRDVNGDSPDEARAATSAPARAMVSALGFRQMGRGRLVGVVVRADGSEVILPAPLEYDQVENMPFGSEEQEVAAVVQSFVDHPQAIILAELFIEGCRDENPSAGVVRLWAVLEALAGNFPGHYPAKVRGALRQLQIGEPEFAGEPLLDMVYRVRNDFMHRGVLAPGDVVGNLRAELASLAGFTLRHAGLAPVIPIAKQRRAHG